MENSKKIKKIVFRKIDKNSLSEIVYDAHGSRPLAEVDYDNDKLLPDSVMYVQFSTADKAYDSEAIEGKEKIGETLQKYIDDGDLRAVSAKSTSVLPKVEYSDVTEQLLLDYEPIRMQDLSDSKAGLWANMGIRKIQVMTDRNFISDDKKEYSVDIVFEKADSKTLDTSIRSIKSGVLNSEGRAIITIDSDEFGKHFTEEFESKKYLTFSGFIEISTDYSKNAQKIIRSEIKITVKNTSAEACDAIDKHIVSVDFGTSSTCVAYITDDGRRALKSLCEVGSFENVNIFENPTNVMLYNWENIYNEWIETNNNVPSFTKSDFVSHLSYLNREDKNGKSSDFDFGYSVKEVFNDEVPPSKRELDSIQTLLKMIPYMIQVENEELQIIPYDKTEEYVYITTDPLKQDKNHFDPVAFYGYLIGRSVNNVQEGKIHLLFRITSPVKFNSEIKNTISRSLKYGIQRSVPKSLRSLVKVDMKNTEPVAYIGAICGTDYLPIDQGQKKYFAVYDFGGGTLDFSFGEISVDEDYVPSIRIFKTNGFDGAGGERIIEKISYNIYCRNINFMVENDIPIKVPYGEKIPADLPSKLNSQSSDARGNLNAISERISRKIFEGKDVNDQEKITMYACDGSEIGDVKLSFDVDEIIGDLEEIVKEKVAIFSKEIDEAFEGISGFKREDVYIFRAGNSSRSEIVSEQMQKTFPNNKVQLVDQIADESEINMRYAITPKTAVAIGQLCLCQMNVYGDEAKFNYYIGYSPMANKFIQVKVSEEWTRFRKIINDTTDIEFRDSVDKQAKPISVDTVNSKDKILFVRIKDECRIEYCISSEDYPKESDDIYIINAKTRTIEKADEG